MKKEKLKNVDANEKIRIEDTKLRNKFKLLKRLMILLEGFLLVPVIMIILSMVIITGEVLISGTNEFATSLISDETLEENDVELGIDDVVGFAEELSGEDLLVDGKSEGFKRVVAITYILMVCLDYMSVTIIVNILAKIFENIEKEGTPFTIKNVKNLNAINVFAAILFVFGTPRISIGFVSIIIISAITCVFKYGYKIQQEVDETL